MWKSLLLVAALAAIIGAPFALKPKENLVTAADRTLVVITPHNEAIRYEFARAFRDYYRTKHGQTVRIDWRVIGGTSEIGRYLASEFETAFANHWRTFQGQPWTDEVRGAFADPRVQPAESPASDAPAQKARRAFLESNVGIGIDLFFGGGSFDFDRQAKAGRLVDCGLLAKRPEWFGDQAIPPRLGGEEAYDPEGRWIGTVLSGYGICSNRDVLARLHVKQPPAQWTELAKPVFFRQLALADPTKSSSAGKAYEMLVQQLMQQAAGSGALDTATAAESKAAEARAKSVGWNDALATLIKLGANTRYFSDTSQKPAVDVGAGDAAAAMSIDFYGRQEAEASATRGGENRVAFVSPAGGTSYGVDPIALLRGAKEPDLAKEFIEFVMSPEGQKLWNYKRGEPGGPVKFSLRRLPVRPDLYSDEHRPHLSDPGVRPYEQVGDFVYRPEWTGKLFQTLGFLIRVMCQDSHDELAEAWKAVQDNGFPTEATRTLLDVSRVTYAEASGPIRQAIESKDKILEVRLAKELGDHFRAQYLRAAQLAREKK